MFDPRATACPCYACLYPPDESGDEALSCAENGVMAPLVGLIGCFQAVEVFKLLSGAGSAHQGLSTFDALSGQWRHFQVPRDPACPVCARPLKKDRAVKDRVVKDRQAVTSVLTVFGGCRCLEVVDVETTALFPYNSDLVQMYEYCAPPHSPAQKSRAREYARHDPWAVACL